MNRFFGARFPMSTWIDFEEPRTITKLEAFRGLVGRVKGASNRENVLSESSSRIRFLLRDARFCLGDRMLLSKEDYRNVRFSI